MLRFEMTSAKGRAPRFARAAFTGAAWWSLAFLSVHGGSASGSPRVPADPPPATPYPILFVTQVPIPQDFTTIGSTFGNHLTGMQSVGRGGDLYIRYPDGSLKNLTAAAGYGNAGFQGASAIAVRDPCMHWSGQKALFSMVIGAPTVQYQVIQRYWQLYEISGFGVGDTPVVVKVPFQPENRNNVAPIYGSDDRILFGSDRVRDGQAHLYPQLDEYEEAPTVSGLYRLNPVVGDLELLTHSPSGDFTPLIDSFGRLLFTRWDHLQRDQQADADNAAGGSVYGTFNWSGEDAGSTPLPTNVEVFPEPRANSPSLPQGSKVNGHSFNHFFPWMAREDGSELETLNHVGRHELHEYFNRSFNDDANLVEFIASVSGSVNPNRVLNLFHLTEDPTAPGRYLAVEAPEFQTHASGQIVGVNLPPMIDPDAHVVEFLTHPDTADVALNPGPDHSGLYREPLVLSDGSPIAVHADTTLPDKNIGTAAAPMSRYAFRLKPLVKSGAYYVAGAPLTPGIQKSISYFDPDQLVTYNGTLWELNPVEVRARSRPMTPPTSIDAPELQAFQTAGVDVGWFRAWLYRRGLALLVTRDVTARDDADRQQPFNLRVPGGSAQTLGAGGKIYDVSWLQLLQGDLIRGLGGVQTPKQGRRVLAQWMHEGAAWNPDVPGAPVASVKVAGDGSVAAVVPAQRAVSWQLLDPTSEPVVRERYWLSFQPGEVRTCANCHGLNSVDQAGGPPPTYSPKALEDFLMAWKGRVEPAPTLGAAGAGAVGGSSGGPYDVLLVNGSAGGSARRVDVPIGAPITIAINPPSGASAARFMLFGLQGAPVDLIQFETGVGTLAFPPPFFAPDLPGFYTVTDNLLQLPGALVPSLPAPWSLSIPGGLPAAFTFTLQGVIEDSGGVSITNGVILRVQ